MNLDAQKKGPGSYVSICVLRCFLVFDRCFNGIVVPSLFNMGESRTCINPKDLMLALENQ